MIFVTFYGATVSKRRIHMTLNVKSIDQEEFDLLQEEWNQLLGQSLSDNVFLRWEWIHTWWKVFQNTNRKLFVVTARRDGQLVGAAPFYIEERGLMRTRYLKLCSDELAPDYLDMIAEKGKEAEVTQALGAYLVNRANQWDVIVLDNLRTDSI